MASLIDTFNSLTRDVYQPEFPDNIFVQSAFWSEFYPHAQSKGGDQVVVKIKMGKLGGGTYREADDTLSLTTGEIVTVAKYDWRHYYVPIQLSAIPVDLNAGAGVNQVADMLDGYIWAAGETMRDDHLGTDIFLTSELDANNETLDGLWDAIQDVDSEDGFGGYGAGNGYGEILCEDPGGGADGTDYLSTWKAHIKRCSGSSASWTPQNCEMEVCREMVNEIVHGPNGCNELPNLAVTTPAVFGKLSREIFNRGLSQPIITRVGERLVKAGFQAFEIDNVPYIADEHCPSTTWTASTSCTNAYENKTGDEIFYLNFKYYYPFFLPKWNLVFDEWLKAPATQHKYTNRLFWWGNAICTQRRALGGIYNIDTTVLYDS